jgi:hypothetical protein
MLKPTYPYYLANKPVCANADLEVTDKYTGEVATRVAMADAGHRRGHRRGRGQPKRWPRARLRAPGGAGALRASASTSAPRNSPHPVHRGRQADQGQRAAKSRASSTPSAIAAERSREHRRRSDRTLDRSARARGYRGMTKRVPIGPLLASSRRSTSRSTSPRTRSRPRSPPGCPFVLKPASLTPLGALIIGEVLAETTCPEGAFSILPCRRDGADLFTTDDRLKLLSFTGSPEVGWDLKARAGKQEGRAGTRRQRRLHRRRRPGDLDDAVVERASSSARSTSPARAASACSASWSMRKHLRHLARQARRRHQEAQGAIRAKRHLHRPGDRRRPKPTAWTLDPSAVEGRRHPALRRRRQGNLLEATLLENVPQTSRPAYAEEAFGPVAVPRPKVRRFRSRAREQSTTAASACRPASSPATSTRPMRAWDVLEVGGVVIGDVPLLARRQHALRRREGQRPRPRRRALRDRGHDRDPNAHPPHAVTPRDLL